MRKFSRECDVALVSLNSSFGCEYPPKAGESQGVSMVNRGLISAIALAAAGAISLAVAPAHADVTVLDHWALDSNSYSPTTGTFTDSGPSAINATVATIAGGTGAITPTATGPFGDSATAFGGTGSYLSFGTNPFQPFIDTSYPAGSGMYSATGNSDTVQAMNGAFSVAVWVNVPSTTARRR